MRRFVVIVLLGLIFSGCSGIRYSEISPEAADFHPKRIGVFPVDVGTYEDARGVIDKIVADVLVDTQWFTGVVAADMVNQQIRSNDDIGRIYLDYLSKLKALSYSDPELSRKIGNDFDIDSFLVIDIIYWNYTKAGDDKVARVEAGIKMINASTGTIIWRAHHHVVESYRVIAPELPNIAKKLMRDMIREMPR